MGSSGNAENMGKRKINFYLLHKVSRSGWLWGRRRQKVSTHGSTKRVDGRPIPGWELKLNSIKFFDPNGIDSVLQSHIINIVIPNSVLNFSLSYLNNRREQNWSEGTHKYRESFQKHLCGVQYTLRQEPRSEIVPHNWRAVKRAHGDLLSSTDQVNHSYGENTLHASQDEKTLESPK